MASFVYVGPKTTFQAPPDKPGGDPVNVLLEPGKQVEIPAKALGLAYIKRLQSRNALQPVETPSVKTSSRRSAKKVEGAE